MNKSYIYLAARPQAVGSLPYWSGLLRADRALPLSRQTGVQRPSTGSDDQKIEAAEQHREVGARLMHRAPEAQAFDSAEVKHPDIVSEQDRKFCRNQRDDHDDDERHRGKPRQQPEDDEQTADGLDNTYERTHDFGKGNADLRETPRTENIGEGQFLNARGQKNNESNEKPHQDGPARFAGPQDIVQGHRGILSDVLTGFTPTRSGGARTILRTAATGCRRRPAAPPRPRAASSRRRAAGSLQAQAQNRAASRPRWSRPDDRAPRRECRPRRRWCRAWRPARRGACASHPRTATCRRRAACPAAAARSGRWPRRQGRSAQVPSPRRDRRRR